MNSLETKTQHILNNRADYKKEDIYHHTQQVLEALENGHIRVCEKIDNQWIVHEWVKKAILLFFQTAPMEKINDCFDKIPLKTNGWTVDKFQKAAFRMVPGSLIRKGTYIAPSVIVMPSFINIGAYIDAGTMVDSFVTVGSCAQIGKNVHLSSNVVIGGVLEPLQAKPIIIEDDAFIGAGSAILEGIIVQQGAVIAAGLTLSSSTKIIDRATGETFYGFIPAYSVVVPGSYKISETLSTNCAVIVKKVDQKTREKTGVNELLRMP